MSLFFIIIISFLPILVWAYIFSYIDWNSLNKKRFLIGISAWIIGVLPIIFYKEIFSFFQLQKLLLVFDDFNFFYFLLLILIFFLFIIIISFLFSFFIKSKNKTLPYYKLKSFLSFCVFSILFLSLVYLVFCVWNFSQIWVVKNNLSLSWLWISSFLVLVFYFLFISLVEEFSKYIWFLGTSFDYISSIKKWVFYSFFVSLGFVFIENVLYFYNTYLTWWFWENFIYMYFSRSVFSLILHVFCTALIAAYFSKAFLKYSKFDIKFFTTFIFGVLLAVLSHTFFNLSLQYSFTFILLIFFLIWYFYISSIFYRN